MTPATRHTPFPRFGPDDMWECWHDEWAGTFEFFCGRRRANQLLNGGMNRVNGKPTKVTLVEEWPELDAVQLRVTTGPAERWEQRQ